MFAPLTFARSGPATHALRGLLAALLVSLSPHLAAATPVPVGGLLVRLQGASPHTPHRDQILATATADRTSSRQAWEAVLAGSGLARLPGWRMEASGAASYRLVPPRPLTAAQTRHWQAVIQAQPGVAWVVPDEREQRLQSGAQAPDDPLFGGLDQQWWLQPVSGSNLSPLEARLRGVPGVQTAWARSTGAGAAVVAVLDTGLRPHPDLDSARFLPGYDFVSDWDSGSGRGYANDGDGRDADPTDPGDWVSTQDQSQDPTRYGGCEISGSSWHGTSVTGLIAATANNGSGGAGIDWATRILPVRVAGKCGASVRDIVDGMRWAAGLAVCRTWRDGLDPDSGCAEWAPLNAHPARVVNISFGGTAACNAEYQAAVDELWARGVVVVAAAGNGHAAPARPASCAQVVGVAAVNRDGFKTSYSNFGAALDIATVGGDDAGGNWGNLLADGGLLSLAVSGAQATTTAAHERHVGTSFATPLVSGTLSLMLAVHPSATASQLVAGLQASARPHVGSPWVAACSADNPGRCLCTTSTCGAGLLDADQAVAYAQALAANQPYVAPNWAQVSLDTAELARASALGQDREPLAGQPSTGGAAEDTGGGAGQLQDLLVLAGVLLAAALMGRSASAARRRQRQRTPPQGPATGPGRRR